MKTYYSLKESDCIRDSDCSGSGPGHGAEHVHRDCVAISPVPNKSEHKDWESAHSELQSQSFSYVPRCWLPHCCLDSIRRQQVKPIL